MKCQACDSEDMYLQSSYDDTSGHHETYKCPHCNCVVTVDINPFRGDTFVSWNYGTEDNNYYSVS